MTDEEELGDVGEDVVATILTATKATDKYDSDKDLTLFDGTEVEVKTQVRWVSENSFSVPSTHTGNQLRKCLNVERLLFVEPGRNGFVRVYDCIDRSYRIKELEGRVSYLFDISKMNLIFNQKSDKICKKMVNLTKTDPIYLV